MKVKTFGKTALLGMAAALLAVGAFSAPAQADPPPASLTVAGAGSDTTQDVVQGLAGFSEQFESWNAGLAHDTICPKDGTPCVTRPNGSGEGVAALRRSQGATVATPWATAPVPVGSDVFDFARSSSGPAAAELNASGALVYVPFAQDFVQYAYHTSSAAPDDLTKAEVIQLYQTGATRGGTIEATEWNGSSAVVGDVTLYIPQSGSGTRSFWLGQVGLTEATIPAWVFDRYNTTTDLPTKAALGGTVVQAQEHDGTVLQDDLTAGGGTNNAIVPFSGAQWEAQSNSGDTGVTDRRHGALLGGTNTDFTRLVYNVVVYSEVTNNSHEINDIFGTAAQGGFICGPDGQAVVELFGFNPVPSGTTCGEALTSRRVVLQP